MTALVAAFLTAPGWLKVLIVAGAVPGSCVSLAHRRHVHRQETHMAGLWQTDDRPLTAAERAACEAEGWTLDPPRRPAPGGFVREPAWGCSAASPLNRACRCGHPAYAHRALGSTACGICACEAMREPEQAAHDAGPRQRRIARPAPEHPDPPRRLHYDTAIAEVAERERRYQEVLAAQLRAAGIYNPTTPEEPVVYLGPLGPSPESSPNSRSLRIVGEYAYRACHPLPPPAALRREPPRTADELADDLDDARVRALLARRGWRRIGLLGLPALLAFVATIATAGPVTTGVALAVFMLSGLALLGASGAALVHGYRSWGTAAALLAAQNAARHGARRRAGAGNAACAGCTHERAEHYYDGAGMAAGGGDQCALCECAAFVPPTTTGSGAA